MKQPKCDKRVEEVDMGITELGNCTGGGGAVTAQCWCQNVVINEYLVLPNLIFFLKLLEIKKKFRNQKYVYEISYLLNISSYLFFFFFNPMGKLTEHIRHFFTIATSSLTSFPHWPPFQSFYSLLPSFPPVLAHSLWLLLECTMFSPVSRTLQSTFLTWKALSLMAPELTQSPPSDLVLYF